MLSLSRNSLKIELEIEKLYYKAKIKNIYI